MRRTFLCYCCGGVFVASNTPAEAAQEAIDRLGGVPGDRVSLCDGCYTLALSGARPILARGASSTLGVDAYEWEGLDANGNIVWRLTTLPGVYSRTSLYTASSFFWTTNPLGVRWLRPRVDLDESYRAALAASAISIDETEDFSAVRWTTAAGTTIDTVALTDNPETKRS